MQLKSASTTPSAKQFGLFSLLFNWILIEKFISNCMLSLKETSTTNSTNKESERERRKKNTLRIFIFQFIPFVAFCIHRINSRLRFIFICSTRKWKMEIFLNKNPFPKNSYFFFLFFGTSERTANKYDLTMA